jgi:U3 small nucleolar RNA-associated protein 11
LHGLTTTIASDADADPSTTASTSTTRSCGKHTVFVDDERALETFDPVKHFDTVPEAVNRTYNRPRKAALAATSASSDVADAAERTAQLRARRYEELRQRGERLQKMERMKQAMTLRKQLETGGRVKLVVRKKDASNGVAVYRWAKERKK